jgi:ABC-type polysaccharide/polyol phosphate export permease
MTELAKQIQMTTNRRTRITGALGDIGGAVARWRLWSAFAIEDLRQTYRRSLLGVFWIFLGFGLFVGVKLFIFGAMLDRADDPYYSAYLMIGFYIWFYLSAVVNSGTTVFINAEGWIRNDPIELPVFVFQNVMRCSFDLLMTGLVVVIGMAYLQKGATVYAFMVLPALLALLLNAFWVNLLLGVLCTRFRDLVHMINAIMRVMFFLTPIFWLPEQLPDRAMDILYWNPFAHFIWIFRTPILDQQFALDSWIYVAALTLIGWTVAILAYAFTRRRLVFWF